MKKLLFILCAVFHLVASALGQTTNSSKAKLEAKHPAEFQFNGGNLKDFLDEIKTTFGVNLLEIGTVPEAMHYSVRVPRLRMGGEGQRLDFRNILNLYNRISEKGNPSMGRWIIEPFTTTKEVEPEAILLVPGGPQGGSAFLVKAFGMPVQDRGEAEKMFQLLERTVEEEKHVTLMRVEQGRYAGVTPSDLEGELRYHPGAGIIVVRGGRVYVELASEIIEAFVHKNRISDLSIPVAPQAGESKTN